VALYQIKGDHHRLALSFLAALGIEDPARIEALPVTDSYAESFLHCYSPGDRSGDEALAALAGRGLAGPAGTGSSPERCRGTTA
jgi:hypothetical protein